MSDDERDGLLAAAIGLRELGRQEEARERLLELAARLPEDAEIAYQTAWAHDVLGLEAEAVPHYERALKATGPTGTGTAGPGTTSGTVPTGAKGLSEKDRKGALLGLGSTFRVLGRYEEAVAVLRGAVEEFPDDGALRTFLAMALFNTGDHHESARLLLRLLAATSDDPSVRRYRPAIEHYAEDLDETV
ncbi:tetratricopeptide repeat protein [Streptomyces sp. NPDC090127]|uniref:tetratricopeptide repeat protein n=1 Tax=Streptomyces sp. NPDC090127 TaxID=3365953 RepID=UPI00382782F4